MAASLLTQDLLTICLLLANGDIYLSVEEISLLTENYQTQSNRHFGISRNDFRSLFMKLIIFEMKIPGVMENLGVVKLADIIPEILKYHYVHFNDEGEHWFKAELFGRESDPRQIEYWFGYNEKEYNTKKILMQSLKEFFKDVRYNTIHPEAVRRFMDQMNLGSSVLSACSRPGSSS